MPGVTVAGTVQNVGGTNSLRLANASVHGSRLQDYRQRIDGFGIGNSYSNYTAMSPIMGSTQEMMIDTAAGSPEQGPGGVLLNIIPKEGGNTFTGSLFAAGATSGRAPRAEPVMRSYNEYKIHVRGRITG